MVFFVTDCSLSPAETAAELLPTNEVALQSHVINHGIFITLNASGIVE